MKRVVLIDDSELIRDLVSASLDAAGYSITCLANPADFRDVPSPGPDVILIDINMPDAFGDDVARFFREVWGVGAPIYFFSDMDENHLRERSEDAGVNGYICKGWGMDELLVRLRKILGTD